MVSKYHEPSGAHLVVMDDNIESLVAEVPLKELREKLIPRHSWTLNLFGLHFFVLVGLSFFSWKNERLTFFSWFWEKSGNRKMKGSIAGGASLCVLGAGVLPWLAQAWTLCHGLPYCLLYTIPPRPPRWFPPPPIIFKAI